jgi:uncharacterized protein YvpB
MLIKQIIQRLLIATISLILIACMMFACGNNKPAVNTPAKDTSSENPTSEEITSENETTEEISSNDKVVKIEGVECVLQNPELPTGCEITSLAIVLNYLSFDVDKCTLADEYLIKATAGTKFPTEAFIGAPTDAKAFGCFAPVIADTANRYLKEGKIQTVSDEAAGGRNTDTLRAVAKEGVSFAELLAMIEEAPVLAWTTMNLQAPYIAQVWEIDGEELYWQNLEHCVVLTGYDAEKGVLYGTDPLYGPCEYDMKLFSIRFQTMYSQVVKIIEDIP